MDLGDPPMVDHEDQAPAAPRRPNRTKIVATLGPASQDVATLRALIRAGMNVARLNFSHGTQAAHAHAIARLREAARLEAVPIAILQDLQGPRLRIGPMRADTWIEAGQAFVLDGRRLSGDAGGAGLPLVRQLARQLAPGHRVLIDDGRIVLEVRRVAAGRIETEVALGGALGSHKGINLPDTALALPPLTAKDRRDLAFGLAQGVDYVALSFVASEGEVGQLQDLIRSQGHAVPVIAKIERRAAVAALEAIVAQADGVMVARGDLALEIGAARVPAVQKALIRAANAAAKPVITATQMLESMIHQPQPTRAETSDVANAILDGTDAVMLSGETAVGAYPVRAVAEMAAIAAEAERIMDYARLGRRARPGRPGDVVSFAISRAAVEIARRADVAAIVAVTSSGLTARHIAHHCPEMPLVGATRHPATWRRMALVWGVIPLLVQDFDSTDEMVRVVGEATAASGFAAPGELVVITSGMPIGQPGSTNMVQVRRVGDWRTPMLHSGASEAEAGAM